MRGLQWDAYISNGSTVALRVKRATRAEQPGSPETKQEAEIKPEPDIEEALFTICAALSVSTREHAVDRDDA
jgi:hypothetical protein